MILAEKMFNKRENVEKTGKRVEVTDLRPGKDPIGSHGQTRGL